MTSQTGFVLALTNVEATLKQFLDNVVSTLKQRSNAVVKRCFDVGHRPCFNIAQRLKSDFGFCFILNNGSTLFQR